MKNLVLDCETVNNPKAVGWENYKAIGISVAVVWDIDDNSWYVFTSSPHIEKTNSISSLPQLLNGNNIIGHNIARFDIPLVQAVAGDFKPGKISDTWIVLYNLDFRKVSLNHMTQYAGIGKKTMHGAEAPLLWQRGEYDKVIEYCKNDVLLEGVVYMKILKQGLVFPDPYDDTGVQYIVMWADKGELRANLMKFNEQQ